MLHATLISVGFCLKLNPWFRMGENNNEDGRPRVTLDYPIEKEKEKGKKCLIFSLIVTYLIELLY